LPAGAPSTIVSGGVSAGWWCHGEKTVATYPKTGWSILMCAAFRRECGSRASSTIKQINRRIKGSEKFWLEGGAEAMLQPRAAQLSQDDRWKRYWARPRKHRRAAGPVRLAQGV
jgi:hypothetical protein